MIKSSFKISLILLYALLLLSFNQTNAQTKPDDKLPLDPQVKFGKLSNGLTYYIRKNNRPEKKLELRLVINAGSILEDDDQQGLAHFTEHMAFNGSRNFKKNDIITFLQSIGVEFGSDLNAYTGFDETVYILPIPTEKKENVEKAFQILEDWASTITFDAKEIEKERGVVLEEDRSGKGAEDRMFRKTYPRIFEGSLYANRLPIGKAEVIKSFKPDAIKRFYKDWYRPNLMAVVAVGDIDPAEGERLIKAHFEKLKNPKNERSRAFADVPGRGKSEGLIVTDKEATNHVVEIYYSFKKSNDKITIKDYREFLIRRLFTSMLSQRMQELTQKAEPPFVFGGSSMGSYARGYEGYSSYAYLGKGGVASAVEALVQENERARKFGFTSSEISRMKKMMMKGIERGYNERDKTESATLVQQYLNHFLDKDPAPGIENEYQYYQQLLEGISLDEVNQYVSKIIPAITENKLVVLTGPEKTEFTLPSNDELLSLANNVSLQDLKPYEEKALASTLMSKLPVPGKIVDEKKDTLLGTTTLKLSNNVTVILKPTDFKNDQVIMTSTRFGGQYLFDVSERYNAEFASTIVGLMGVGEFSPVDLRKVLAGKNAGVSPRLGAISESMNGQCSAADIETMLQLTHLYFTQPRQDSELFKSFISKQQALYQNMGADPEYIFQDSLYHILYRDHPWAPLLPNPETFNKINQQRAVEIYQERFSNASGFTFVLVGKINIDSIKPLLATYLASLPSTGKESKYKDVGLKPAKGPIKKEIKKGTEPKSIIRLTWNGDTPYSNEEQLIAGALVEVINIKLTERLREEMGGIYNGGMYGSLNKHPYNSYSFGVSLPCGPENVNKLIDATLDEIKKVQTKGVSETDLNKVKEQWKQQYLVNIKDNSFWARVLVQSVELGNDPARILTYEKRINKITSKDLQQVAQKYLDLKNYVQIVLNPEVTN